MKTNKQLAEIVAERFEKRLSDGFIEIVQDIATDLLIEEGYDLDTDEAWDTAMDVVSRIYVGAQ